MHELNNEKFGLFLAELRREKGMTQKELAEKLFVSDKAVSKWERGLSMPDVSLLAPLSELLGVTIAELLKGERVGGQLELGEVEKLVAGSLGLSERVKRRVNRRWAACYAACLLVAAMELMLLRLFAFPAEELRDVLLVECLCLLFGGWLCIFARERLPAYYDSNRISAYSDGVFRMNLPGVRLNNKNWPHILRAGRVYLMAASLTFQPLYVVIRGQSPDAWADYRLPVMLIACLGFMVPMMIAGKRYE